LRKTWLYSGNRIYFAIDLKLNLYYLSLLCDLLGCSKLANWVARSWLFEDAVRHGVSRPDGYAGAEFLGG
jgi:hypothetical protein